MPLNLQTVVENLRVRASCFLFASLHPKIMFHHMACQPWLAISNMIEHLWDFSSVSWLWFLRRWYDQQYHDVTMFKKYLNGSRQTWHKAILHVHNCDLIMDGFIYLFIVRKYNNIIAQLNYSSVFQQWDCAFTCWSSCTSCTTSPIHCACSLKRSYFCQLLDLTV